jgi:LmbE family N-acetylglucosaminyl deacetylase
MNTALVVAAHPDDEVLGCGATIARLSHEGWKVHVLIVAEGVTSRESKRDVDAKLIDLSALAKCAQEANKILGTASVDLLSLPDNRMDSIQLLDVVKIVEEYVYKYKPSLLFTHHAGDVNIDHRVLHDAVIAASRPQPEHAVKELLFFEVPSSTEWRPEASGIYFKPNYFYDVSAYISKKIAALSEYSHEIRNFPHPRSLDAVNHLASWRGASVGCKAAEAFMLGRCIV